MKRLGTLFLGVLGVRLDAGAAAVLADTLVPDLALDQGEQRVVAA
jgi:hypothetical protein